ncbi:MAG: B-box zinc finger protein [Acidimicrobiia bacterium]
MGHCDNHYGEPAVAVCRDCQRTTCEPCRVQVRRIGSLCTHCALVRAGLRPRTVAARF